MITIQCAMRDDNAVVGLYDPFASASPNIVHVACVNSPARLDVLSDAAYVYNCLRRAVFFVQSKSVY